MPKAKPDRLPWLFLADTDDESSDHKRLNYHFVRNGVAQKGQIYATEIRGGGTGGSTIL